MPLSIASTAELAFPVSPAVVNDARTPGIFWALISWIRAPTLRDAVAKVVVVPSGLVVVNDSPAVTTSARVAALLSTPAASSDRSTNCALLFCCTTPPVSPSDDELSLAKKRLLIEAPVADESPV